MTTWSGLSSLTSRSRSFDLRTPKNDQTTASSVRSSEALRRARRAPTDFARRAHDASSPGRRRRRRQRHVRARPASCRRPRRTCTTSVIVRTSFGSLRSMTNTTGHCFDSPGFSTCSVKQKHSSFLKCAIATAGRVARERLRRHRPVLAVAELVHHGRQLARMDVDLRLRRLEVPRPARVGVELDRHRAAEVDLRVGRRRGRVAALQLGAREHVDAEHVADRPVDRHERVAEREHQRGDDDELADHAPVVGDEAGSAFGGRAGATSASRRARSWR